MDVYQNGVLLKPGTDYTATTGTTVVLVTAASLNDVVEMVVYDAFSVADSYTKSQSDTRYPFKGNNSIIRLNGQTISADITIDSDENGVSAGPITQTMLPLLLMDIGVSYDQSVLNVDTIADKAGTGPVALTKQHAAKKACMPP